MEEEIIKLSHIHCRVAYIFHFTSILTKSAYDKATYSTTTFKTDSKCLWHLIRELQKQASTFEAHRDRILYILVKDKNRKRNPSRIVQVTFTVFAWVFPVGVAASSSQYITLFALRELTEALQNERERDK